MSNLWTVTISVLIGLSAGQDSDNWATSSCVKLSPNENLDAYPWFLPMHYDGHYICGVVIIANEVVLTAAHCVLTARKDLIRIYMRDQTERRAVEIYIHDAYNAYQKNHDIAVIRLNQKFSFGGMMSPVCLPVTKQEPVGKTGRALGWQFLSSDLHVANALLQVDMMIYSHNECSKMRFKPGSITGNMVCAGNRNRNLCHQGEASGPLVTLTNGQWEMVGVTAWVQNCGQWGYPQVNAKMMDYVDWICGKMRSMKIDNVECHCSRNPASHCHSCGKGFNGRIVETEPFCNEEGQDMQMLARSSFSD